MKYFKLMVEILTDYFDKSNIKTILDLKSKEWILMQLKKTDW